MVGAEQLMDLGAQALDRRYSSCHGCRSSLVLGRSREPTPVAHLHQRPDATHVFGQEPREDDAVVLIIVGPQGPRTPHPRTLTTVVSQLIRSGWSVGAPGWAWACRRRSGLL